MKSYIPLSLTVVTTSCFTPFAFAQTATPAPAKPAAAKPAAPATKPFAEIGGFSITGQLRSRVENWGWFKAPGFTTNDTFTGTQLRLNALKTDPRYDIGIDLQEVLLTGVDPNTVAPAPRGSLGFPGNYRAANGGQDGALSLKQAYVRFKNISGKGSSVRLGRFEFNDGVETVSKDGTLNWLKQQRLSQRLIGTFGYSHVGRAFDGAQLVFNNPEGNFTAVAARPTEGVFQLEANDDIDSTGFLYGAYTRPFEAGEARLFGMAYEDGREAPKSIKTDNRALALRAADDENIRVYTLGANLIKTLDTSSGKVDLLAWGAWQTGDWGKLDHRANAYSLEAGYQPKKVQMKPWLRAGYYRSSGDGDGTDGKHGTFFSGLPTPRVYARFPFYNQMNSEDLFAQVILRPTPKFTWRAEAHRLKLTSGKDLWYAGGGAFQDSGFGYAGRPANGNRDLGTLLDLGCDYTVNPKTTISAYYARVNGGKVISQSYPAGNDGHLAYVEITRKF